MALIRGADLARQVCEPMSLAAAVAAQVIRGAQRCANEISGEKMETALANWTRKQQRRASPRLASPLIGSSAARGAGSLRQRGHKTAREAPLTRAGNYERVWPVAGPVRPRERRQATTTLSRNEPNQVDARDERTRQTGNCLNYQLRPRDENGRPELCERARGHFLGPRARSPRRLAQSCKSSGKRRTRGLNLDQSRGH